MSEAQAWLSTRPSVRLVIHPDPVIYADPVIPPHAPYLPSTSACLIEEFKESKKPLPPPFNVLWLALFTLPIVKLRNAENDALSGFKLLPGNLLLRTYRAQEQEALKRVMEMRKKKEAETIEAQMALLSSAMAKLDAQGRKNFEAVNGCIDEMKALRKKVEDASSQKDARSAS